MRPRRRRDEPFNPFAPNAGQQRRERRIERQREVIRDVQRNLESGISDFVKKSKPKNLKSPHSPIVDTPFDRDLNEQTKEAKAKLESSLQQRKKEVKSTKQVLDFSEMMNMISDLDERMMKEIRDDLLKEVKEEQMGIAGNRNNAWLDDEVNRRYRELHIFEYELKKDENNKFLRNFDVSNLDGPHIRALILVNDNLSSHPVNATHIGDGKIISFREGVRIVVDARRILQSSLQQESKIWIYVGPNNKEVCLHRSDLKTPGLDYIVHFILFSVSGWPKAILKEMKGAGTLDIGYQLNKRESKEYTAVKRIAEQYYESMKERMHSIEVYSQTKRIIIGTLSKENKLKLIGKKGSKVDPLRQLIKSDIGKDWSIHVQKLE